MRRRGASLLLFLLVSAVVISPFALAPRPAKAIPVEDPMQWSLMGWAQAQENIWLTMAEGAAVAVVGAADYFIQQMAYSAAVALTSDCPGQAICWDSRAFKDGFKQAWQGAIGEAVGQLSEVTGLTEAGFDLCHPGRIMLDIQLGLLAEVEPPKPKCDFNEIVADWEAAVDQFTTPELLDFVSLQFEPGQAPLVASLEVWDTVVFDKQVGEQRNYIAELFESAAAGGGFDPVQDPVTGRKQAPAAWTQSKFEQAHVDPEKQRLEQSGQVTAGQIARGAVVGVVMNAVSTFTQTLAARLLNKLVDGLMSADELLELQPDLIINPEAVLQPPGRIGAERAATRRFTAPLPRSVELVDPLLDFITCPDIGRQSSNCVMDSQFANAVRVSVSISVTVADAIEQGMLHGDWPMISSLDTVSVRDKYCYTKGYCEPNLKKLRAANVIPVGWEIAAHNRWGGIDNSPLLKEVVAGFNDCNEIGGRDETHPYCKLIDPDWVLKIPPTQCKAKVYGPVLASPEASARLEYCADTQTCLREDDRGNCTGGFGYCLASRNVWRFNGDQCPAQFNSCRSLTGRDGQSRGYLLNTIDYGVCNADTVGCRSYSMLPNAEEVAADPSDDWSTTSSLMRYFNKNAEKCSVADNGCTALLRFGKDDSLNLVRNGGFEEVDDKDHDGDPDSPGWWHFPNGSVQEGHTGHLSRDGTESSSGLVAVFLNGNENPIDTFNKKCDIGSLCDKIGGCTCDKNNVGGGGEGRIDFQCGVPFGEQYCYPRNSVEQSGIPMEANKTYTLSVTYKPDNSSARVNGDVHIRLYPNVGLDPGGLMPVNYSGLSIPSTMSFSRPDEISIKSCDVSADGESIHFRFRTSSNVPDLTASCTFAVQMPGLLSTFVSLLESRPLFHAKITLESREDAWVDNVMFEEGYGTAFHEEYGTAEKDIVNARVAPLWMGCRGNEGDPEECGAFAKVCPETDVGCASYTPVNGDPAVPGIITDYDHCPAECVGYDTFKQEASLFDKEKFPVYFIPSTARGCNASDAGCSEFTNLETEAREYFSRLRICTLPGAGTTDIFYTWQGSEEAGYQLRVWRLLVSDESSAPCTKLRSGGGTVSCDDSGTEGKCLKEDIDAGSFDCREFYDSGGNRHYRRISMTIEESETCSDYRITESSESDCEGTNGRWDTQRKDCVYSIDVARSVPCAAASSGCRAYSGNTGSNVRSMFYEDFESGLNNDLYQSGDGWGNADGGSSEISVSSESLHAGGHSVRVGPRSGGSVITRDVSRHMEKGRSYMLDFWARGEGKLEINLSGADSNPPEDARWFSKADDDPGTPTVELVSNWQKYSVGPVFFDWDEGEYAFPQGVLLRFDLDNGSTWYIDNADFRMVQDHIYAVRNSWSTPDPCDQTHDGVPSPREMLGCREYKDLSGQSLYLRSFSRLCREGSIGCTAYSNLQHTPDNPYEQKFNQICSLSSPCAPRSGEASCPCKFTYVSSGTPTEGVQHDFGTVCRVAPGEQRCYFDADTIVPEKPYDRYPFGLDAASVKADSRIYLVIEDSDRCSATVEGCKSMGTPELIYEDTCSLGSVCTDPASCVCVPPDGNGLCYVKEGDNSCAYQLNSGFAISKWSEVAFRDDPDKYGETLCTVPAVGCEEYRATDGGLEYFKDPGNRVCEYKASVTYKGLSGTQSLERSGWFRKSESGELFPCDPTMLKNAKEYGIPKNSDPSCTLPGQCNSLLPCPCADPFTGESCMVEFGEQSCGYQGWVGLCDPKYNMCEEFIDPYGASGIVEAGTPYYYIDNNKLDRTSCDGQASLKKGCVLLDQTSRTRKTYSSRTTYLKSNNAGGDAVSPVDCNSNPNHSMCQKVCAYIQGGKCSFTGEPCTMDAQCGGGGEVCAGQSAFDTACVGDADCAPVGGKCFRISDLPFGISSMPNDSNTVIKVRRDRECSKWLECVQSDSVWDENKSEWFSSCSGFGTCTELDAAGAVKGCSDTGWTEVPFRRYTEEEYVTRSTTWHGEEWTGYTILGAYPVQFLSSVDITGDKSGVCRDYSGNLLDALCNDSEADCGQGAFCDKSYIATNRVGVVPPDNPDCERDEDCPGYDGERGQCVGGHCVYDFYGGKLDDDNMLNAPSCRGFPEKDSPFMSSVNDGEFDEASGQSFGKKTAFAGAYVCTKDNFCECAYTRYKYGGGTSRFLSWLDPEYNFSKICIGGENDGAECADADACGESGSCQKKTEETFAMGWYGFCVDYDMSFNINGSQDQYACNLWLPRDKLSGAPDRFNMFPEAGWVGATDSWDDSEHLWYCTEAEGNAYGDDNSYRVKIAEGNEVWWPACSGSDVCPREDTNLKGFAGDFKKSELASIDVILTYSEDAHFYLERDNPTEWLGGSSNIPEEPDGCEDHDMDPCDTELRAGISPYDVSASGKNCRHWLVDEGADAEGECGGGAKNCIGAKAKFTDSKLSSVRAISCWDDAAGKDSYDVPVLAYAEMRERCNTFASMNDPGKEFNMFPLTDRMYQAMSSPQDGQSGLPPYELKTEYPLIGNEDISPFGHSSKTGSSLGDTLLPVYETEGGSPYWRRVFVENEGYQTNWGDISDVAGIPFACEGPCGRAIASDQGSGVTSEAVRQLKKLFAKSWGTQEWGGGEYQPGDSATYDARADLTANDTLVPKVIAVDPLKCTSGGCEEGPEGMTVNDKYLPGSEVCGEGGSVTVIIRYYGYAHKDHMPIRRKIFDFGDNSSAVASGGFYKNHRGIVDAGDPGKGTLCDGSEWGRTSASCDTRYFEEKKTYVCSEGIGSGLPACGLAGEYPCTRGDGACVFKPRVQLLDNWGFCNGSCSGEPGLGNTCMDQDPNNKDVPGSLDDGTANECVLRELTDRDNYNAQKKPWTEFKGEIKVYPVTGCE